jgi:hypothetical protein
MNTPLKQKYVAFGLVRDSVTGKPKVDDPSTLHPVQLGMMSEAERTELGVWPGCWARDAQGYKRLTKLGDLLYRAEDNLVAVSEVFDLPADAGQATIMATTERVDVPAGQNLGVNLEVSE